MESDLPGMYAAVGRFWRSLEGVAAKPPERSTAKVTKIVFESVSVAFTGQIWPGKGPGGRKVDGWERLSGETGEKSGENPEVLRAGKTGELCVYSEQINLAQQLLAIAGTDGDDLRPDLEIRRVDVVDPFDVNDVGTVNP